MKPIIALIGRPNVGKSTLFNRLTKTKAALVADIPGLTRDRHYGEAKQGKSHYIVIDTGGFEPRITDGVVKQMAMQTEEAIVEADVIVFLVDGRVGITAEDKVIASKLRVSNKPIYVAVNKVEGVDRAIAISDFYALGLTNLYPISSSHGDGVFNLFNQIFKQSIPTKDVDLDNSQDLGVTFAVIGRPNVGKSTLVNAILGEDRVIVYDEAGTTRDSIYVSFELSDKRYTIIDTAGIRRKGRVVDKVEKFSLLKSIQAISDAQVVVLVLDAKLSIDRQDAVIVGYALEAGKSIVVAINKWDSISQDKRNELKEDLKQKLKFLDFAKFVYISALKKKGIGDLMISINESYQSAFIKMPTPKLTRVLQEAVSRQMPTFKGAHRPKLRYAHQGGVNPPTIIIHGNSLENVSKSYTRYLEHSFRKSFNLIGTPLTIEYKLHDNPYHDKQKERK